MENITLSPEIMNKALIQGSTISVTVNCDQAHPQGGREARVAFAPKVFNRRGERVYIDDAWVSNGVLRLTMCTYKKDGKLVIALHGSEFAGRTYC